MNPISVHWISLSKNDPELTSPSFAGPTKGSAVMSKWVLRVVSSQVSYCCVDTLRKSSPITLVYYFFLSGFQHTWHATPTLWSPSSFSTFMTCRWNIIGAFLVPCKALSNCQCRPHSSSLSILDHVEWFLAVDAGVE